ncbi:MAG TPA: DUF1549 and DUF1553 domain-containing protein, partial [Caulifigura sp.]|nr:DUF1549 and DUF1553 domain-containing protein [Caulifigura sp.]
VPGNANDSLIWQKVESGEMPPGKAKVSAAEKELLRRWIAAGAPTVRLEPESLAPGLGITPEERSWWAFQPIRRPEPPKVQAADRVANPIDAFVLAKLEAEQLTFNPQAEKVALVRRAYFDLLGLPPTYEQVQAFVNDQSPNAWPKLIDDLLNSPHYGEHWGRHWLDVAGYADSDGVSAADPVRPYAYKFRDSVIRSLNADKPFSEFIIEQLAGDELVPQPPVSLTPEQIETLTATGFLRMAADGSTAEGDADLNRNQVVADTIKIVTSSLYGLSVGCAQCHDHRYDPIPQTDYFAIRANLEPALNPKAWKNPPQRQVSLYTDADRTKAAEIEAEAGKLIAVRDEKQAKYLEASLEKELEKHPAELREALREAYKTEDAKRTPEQKKLLSERPSVNINPGNLYQYDMAASEDLKKLGSEIEAVRAKKPVEDYVAALTEPATTAPVTYLFHRGDHRQPKDPIKPGDLQIASAPEQPVTFPDDDSALPSSGRRLAWAKWLTSGQHPLVARVIVNRVWLNHFGRGIVGTPGDFGKLGEMPTHPELLDWLATEFMANGWSLKSLHRQIMLSSAYQQSSRRTPEKDSIDGDNRLYGRMPVRRLEAEAIRDRMLAASGSLDRTPFGPAIPVMADDAGQIIVQNGVPRRSVYLQVRRTQPESMLTAFDAPVMDLNCERRPSSTVASQSLMLMNSESVLQIARKLADRARKEPGLPAGLNVAPEMTARLKERAGSPWSYGYGGVDEAAARVTSFTPLAHWNGAQWQSGSMLPDAEHGWVLVNAVGGHPSGRQDHSSIRRWTSPIAGELSIAGALKHGSPNGDGVRGRIVSNRQGVVGTWTAANGSSETQVASINVEPGDTIDFVVDCQTNENADSFEWRVKIQSKSTSQRSWSSDAEFHGPIEKTPPVPDQLAAAWRQAYSCDITQTELDRVLAFAAAQLDLLGSLPGDAKKVTPPADDELLMLTNVCQQLISSNEFLYVD